MQNLVGQPYGGDNAYDAEHVAPVLDPVTRIDDGLGRAGEFRPETFIHFLEGRHDIGQHEVGDAQRDHDQRNRIEHCRFDAGLDGLLLLQHFDKAVEEGVELTGNLAGLDHVQIDRVKMAVMFLEGCGQG